MPKHVPGAEAVLLALWRASHRPRCWLLKSDQKPPRSWELYALRRTRLLVGAERRLEKYQKGNRKRSQCASLVKPTSTRCQGSGTEARVLLPWFHRRAQHTRPPTPRTYRGISPRSNCNGMARLVVLESTLADYSCDNFVLLVIIAKLSVDHWPTHVPVVPVFSPYLNVRFTSFAIIFLLLLTMRCVPAFLFACTSNGASGHGIN